MTNEQKNACRAIIHSASLASAGVGAGSAKIPLADNIVIVPIQTSMIIGLGKVFGYTLKEGAVKAAVGTAVTTQVGQIAFRTLVGFLPLAGEIVKAGVAGGFTEALGWLIADEFDKGNIDEANLGEILKAVFNKASKLNTRR